MAEMTDLALVASLFVMCAACIGFGWWAQGFMAAMALHRARRRLDRAKTKPEFDSALDWWIKATRRVGWSR